MDISSTVKAAVTVDGFDNDMVMPEHTTMFLTTQSADEAHYVAAVLNSDPVNTIVSGYIVDNHLSTHPIENIVVPKFDRENTSHTRLASLSEYAHQAAAQGDVAAVKNVEQAINEVVKGLW